MTSENRERIEKGLQRIDGRMHYAGVELPLGEWHSEPDHVDFEAHGFPCILHRGPLGAWCGYVGVPPGHPWHSADYDKVRVGEEWPDVHGGLTYGRKCLEPICHVPKPGESDDVWWLGFDCSHLGDIVPCMLAIDARMSREHGVPPRSMSPWGESYKNVDFVRAETGRLASQAAAAAKAVG